MAAGATAPAEAPPLLAWLLAAPDEAAEPAPRSAELALLAELDERIAAATLPSDLLPRAASVMPQLLALLRRGPAAREAMVGQVVKDVQLTAEVLRLARSPAYGALPINTLESAIDRIGTSGLQSAMARVLLKPVFGASRSGPAARAGERVWQLAEYKSLLCAQLVQQQGGERFDGFLAGLLHDTGLLGLLRLVERGAAALPLPPSPALENALLLRRDRLFGRLAAAWDLAPALTTLAQRLQRHPLDDDSSVLATALRSADHCARADLARQPAIA